VPQGFVKIGLITVLDILGVPAVFQVSNSQCYNYTFVTEVSSLLLRPERCLVGGASGFFLMKTHISGERRPIPQAPYRRG